MWDSDLPTEQKIKTVRERTAKAKNATEAMRGVFHQSEAADRLKQVLSPIGDEIAKI
jgi:hypothetical protein